MKQVLLRSAAILAALATAAPAAAVLPVTDVGNLVQNTRTAIQTINQLIEMKNQGLQAVANAKRYANLDNMLNQVQRSATQLTTEGQHSTTNGLYALNPDAANVMTTMRSTLTAAQGFPGTSAAALTRLTNSIGASQGAAQLKNYDGMYAHADNAVAMSRSIADVERDRAQLARDLNDYAAEGHALGDNNLSASVQHLASGNLLNGRQLNKMMVSQNLVAQQQQEQINRNLEEESRRLESHIRDLQAAQDAQNITVTNINASPIY